MGLISGSYYLIVAGVFAATLSSALGFLVSAPKIFQVRTTWKKDTSQWLNHMFYFLDNKIWIVLTNYQDLFISACAA